MESPDDPLVAEEPYLLRRPFMSPSNVDDGTLVTSVATVVSTTLLDCAADLQSSRRDDIKSSGFVLHGEVVLRKEGQPPRHPLREVGAVYGRA